MNKRKGKKGKRSGLSKESATEQIQIILSKSPQQGFNYKQIAKRLNINDPAEKQMVSEIMKELSNKGSLKEVYEGKFKAQASRGYITGSVDMTSMG